MYDDRFYDRGVSRNNSQEAVSRVASEIFHHDLMQASMDTRSLLQHASGRDAQGFVDQVNRQLQNMNRYSGQDDSLDCGNFLQARQTYDRYGQLVERVSMVSADGQHSRAITEVPNQPYSRVPMNFNQYQDGENRGPGYYNGQQPYAGAYRYPVQPSAFDSGSTGGFSDPSYGYGDQSYAYRPVNYGYSGYNPGHGYHRPYYGYPQGGGSLVAGLLIGSAVSRLIHI